MLYFKKAATLLSTGAAVFALAQSGSLSISVFDEFSKTPLPATIVETRSGTTYSGTGTVSLPNLSAAP